jgi:hypothetical protein
MPFDMYLVPVKEQLVGTLLDGIFEIGIVQNNVG